MPLLVAPDSRLVQRCLRAVQLPDRAITQAELEELWGTDRARLRTCALRHGALRDFYATRDAGLRGDP